MNLGFDVAVPLRGSYLINMERYHCTWKRLSVAVPLRGSYLINDLRIDKENP